MFDVTVTVEQWFDVTVQIIFAIEIICSVTVEPWFDVTVQIIFAIGKY